jgi:hypothetical protein
LPWFRFPERQEYHHVSSCTSNHQAEKATKRGSAADIHDTDLRIFAMGMVEIDMELFVEVSGLIVVDIRG